MHVAAAQGGCVSPAAATHLMASLHALLPTAKDISN